MTVNNLNDTKLRIISDILRGDKRLNYDIML